ncbi:hypothetical protein CFC21_054549 [Triticum aestivum]|uniref:Uncharacterized protein n=3 Tax=Triticum TaxID=4564 RepID=A0A9R1K936_WHEAT|nr:hypothetical protein CFC21_054549 [Triticum aestivum]CDM85428.1 unnamed protein product [Triticum aestivum]VAH98496.1 unnamed protein product [Triticum turgidum subsp. durum]
MASGSVPLGRTRRGLVSCAHSLNCRADDAPLPLYPDLEKAIYELIVNFYDQAFNRLPCDRIPGLRDLLTTAGTYLGLLDPVSNIMLNTIALLPEGTAGAASTAPPAAKKSKRPARNAWQWHDIANRSYNSLLGFLMAYFGCLCTKQQAARYLYWADANLSLAVMLVQHDLYYAEVEALDPESDRTQAALEWAATMAGHPSPSVLTKLMSSGLKEDDFHLLEKLLFSAPDVPLKADDVGAIDRILCVTMSPPCLATIIHTRKGSILHVHKNHDAAWSSTPSTMEDNKITSTALSWDGKPISSLQCGLPDKLQHCLGRADGLEQYLKKTPCSVDTCDYLQTLKMRLQGMIHNFCIKALKLLPTPSGSFMRGFLMAGHCYGSMDPVSIIIVNSIWYNSHSCPLLESERSKIEKYNDILDPHSLLRTQVHSLKGLMELATFVGPQFSTEACALELLCDTRCDIVDMLQSSPEMLEKKNPLHEAAKAAGHPLPLQLGELHQLLLMMPDERSALLSLMTEARTGRTVLRLNDMTLRMRCMWLKCSAAKTGGIVRVPKLFPESRKLVSSMRSKYEERRSWFRSKIEQVLKDYTTQHFWEPKYKLDIIFGVEAINQGRPPLGEMCYRVNFTATSDLQLQRMLFFAEFLFSGGPRPETCCPLPYEYAGRCYYGEQTTRKIMYPDEAKYIPHDITHYGTRRVDDMLEMDVVHFSSEMDVELTEKLNKMHAH